MNKILFLSANPREQDKLAYRYEFESIVDAVRSEKYGDEIEIIRVGDWVSLEKLEDSLYTHKPQIVHFFGRGSRRGEPRLQSSSADELSAPIEAIGNLFKTERHENIRCVILDAIYYSKEQAEEIAKYIDTVIGTSSTIPDHVAAAFFERFYSGLANAESIEAAFEKGRFRSGTFKSSIELIREQKHSVRGLSDRPLIDTVKLTADSVFMDHLVKRGVFRDKDEGIEFIRKNEDQIRQVADLTMNVLQEQKEFAKPSPVLQEQEYSQRAFLDKIVAQMFEQLKDINIKDMQVITAVGSPQEKIDSEEVNTLGVRSDKEIVARTKIEIGGDVLTVLPRMEVNRELRINPEILKAHMENLNAAVQNWKSFIDTVMRVVEVLSASVSQSDAVRVSDTADVLRKTPKLAKERTDADEST